MFSRWLQIDPTKSALILGPRRAGKTTYLQQKFPQVPYVTLDDLDIYEWAKRDPKGFIAQLGPSAIIDEIQRLPSLTIAIKYAIDNQNAVFYMTGSSSIGLLDSTADSLAGRVNLYHFPTSCWGESQTSPIQHPRISYPELKEAHRDLETACRFGLFPEVLNQSTNTKKFEILKNYRDTYFVRDMMQLANLENLDGILAIYHHLIRSIGSHLEITGIAQESGLSVPTTRKYLNALYQSDLCFKLYGYQYGPAKRYIKASKSYFADNGIPAAFSPMLSHGQIIENFVISELEKRRKLGFIQTDAFYYYKTVSGKEIDLVYEANGVVHAIEIKSTRIVKPKDLSTLLSFKNNLGRPCSLVLYYLGDDIREDQGVEIRPIGTLFGRGTPS